MNTIVFLLILYKLTANASPLQWEHHGLYLFSAEYFGADVVAMTDREPETDVNATQAPHGVVESPHLRRRRTRCSRDGRGHIMKKKRGTWPTFHESAELMTRGARCGWDTTGCGWLLNGAGDETGVKGAEVNESPNRGDAQGEETDREGATRQSQVGQLIINTQSARSA
ncbi:hypothetical protein B0T10DRAFT_475790, partial [Thelonectria olida]